MQEKQMSLENCHIILAEQQLNYDRYAWHMVPSKSSFAKRASQPSLERVSIKKHDLDVGLSLERGITINWSSLEIYTCQGFIPKVAKGMDCLDTYDVGCLVCWCWPKETQLSWSSSWAYQINGFVFSSLEYQEDVAGLILEHNIDIDMIGGRNWKHGSKARERVAWMGAIGWGVAIAAN